MACFFVMGGEQVREWLVELCARHIFDVRAVYRRSGEHPWPLEAADEEELEAKLREGGHLLPLPKEPAALANVIEVSLVDFILSEIGSIPGAMAKRGTERGYPDLEIYGPAFGGAHHAIDVKVARRNRAGTQTQSRITLYTGNTYFMWPSLHWPGTFRPFQDYETHLDVICLYTFDGTTSARVEDLELIVQEPWRIASRQRSSTTRQYIGAVTRIDALRDGRGEFDTPAQFYEFWRKYKFNISQAVQNQLQKLLASYANRTKSDTTD